MIILGNTGGLLNHSYDMNWDGNFSYSTSHENHNISWSNYVELIYIWTASLKIQNFWIHPIRTQKLDFFSCGLSQVELDGICNSWLQIVHFCKHILRKKFIYVKSSSI